MLGQKRLQDSQKRLQLSRLNIPDDLTEKIGKEFTKKAGKKLTRKKSKNKIGGLQKKKTIMSNDSWENPHIDKKMDCCPCVFYYLGLINDDDYVQLYNKYSETGMQPVDIEIFFKSKYPHFNFKVLNATLYNKSNEEIAKIIRSLFKSIKKGYSVIGGIYRMDSSGHCLVFSRTLDNKIAIHDSQMNTAYLNQSNIQKYFIENEVYSLFYFHSNYHKNITEKNDPLMLNSNNQNYNYHHQQLHLSHSHLQTHQYNLNM